MENLQKLFGRKVALAGVVSVLLVQNGQADHGTAVAIVGILGQLVVDVIKARKTEA